jgi:hypothetical protein
MSVFPSIPGLPGLPTSVISIQYQGGDISSLIQPNLKRLSYHDRISYQSDNLEFTIADPNGQFRNQFTFTSGTSLQFGLTGLNWAYPGEVVLANYGSFAITRVTASQSGGAGSEVDIRCSTIPPGTSFRLEMKFQRWTESTLQNIANQIVAANPPLTLSYLASTDPFVATIEQYDESDMVCLSRIAQTVGMSMKIKNNTVIIFSRKEFEAKPPKGTITFPPGLQLPGIPFDTSVSYGVNGVGGMESWSCSDNLDGCFKGCRVVIRSPYSGLTTTGLWDDPNNPPVGATLQKRQNIYPPSYPAAEAVPNGTYYDGNQQNKESADQIAYNELRRRAEKRHQLQFTVPFCLKIESGDVWTCQNIGPDFDGNYIFLEAEQSIGEGGSQTRASAERCLAW